MIILVRKPVRSEWITVRLTSAEKAQVAAAAKAQGVSMSTLVRKLALTELGLEAK